MKVAIIGCAHMQIQSYTQILIKKGIPVVGVYDRNTIRGNKFAKTNNIKYFPNLEKLFKQDFNTVVICSENSLHYDYALAAAFHRKNIIIEKPLALTTHDAMRMILTCQKHGVKLLVAHPIRFSKTIIDLKKAYENGELGNIIAINGVNRGKNPGGWFLNKELAGGGAIIDHAVHLVDLSKWIFDFEVDSIFTLKHATKEVDIEDMGLIHFQFTNNVFMSLDTSWDRPLNYPVWGDVTLQIITDKGQIIVDGMGRRVNLFLKDTNYSYAGYEKHMDEIMIDSFIECIKEDTPIPVSGEDGLYTVKIAELAYQSANLKRVIHKEEFQNILESLQHNNKTELP